MNLSETTVDKESETQLPAKIVIIGTSGCGKNTLGNKLSALTGKKCIDLDDLYWLPNWTKRIDEKFSTLIQQELAANEWIICGNYSLVRQQIWSQADRIIWLDLPLSTCLWRALKRSFRRWIKQERCCNGNYETLSRLFGKDSILLWIWSTHSRRKRSYSNFFANNSDTHRLIRLKNSKEIEHFIGRLPSHSSLALK